MMKDSDERKIDETMLIETEGFAHYEVQREQREVQGENREGAKDK
jgi:hypothetical protein